MHTYAFESACELLQASFLNLTMENNEKTAIEILRRIILEKGIFIFIATADKIRQEYGLPFPFLPTWSSLLSSGKL